MIESLKEKTKSGSLIGSMKGKTKSNSSTSSPLLRANKSPVDSGPQLSGTYDDDTPISTHHTSRESQDESDLAPEISISISTLDDAIEQGKKTAASYASSHDGMFLPADVFETFRATNSYSGKTFQLLQWQASIPRKWAVGLDDELLQFTLSTSDVLVICNQAQVHWVLVHVHLPTKSMTYWDALKASRSQPDHTICSLVSAKISQALREHNRGQQCVPDGSWHPSSTKVRRSITQTDGSNCGPLTWREAEVLLGYSDLPVDVNALRYRHCKQINDAALQQSTTTAPLREGLPLLRRELWKEPWINLERHNKHWSQDEKDLMLKLANKGVTIDTIARELGRSYSSVSTKYRKYVQKEVPANFGEPINSNRILFSKG